ncbi:MAG: sodium:solute symporter family transporter [Planctomycetota bacterium]|jgi:Na+/proline symporter
MTGLDVAIIVAYFLGIVAVGLYFSRRAAKGMRSYFLGGNNLPWWALAASGSASNYDVTGTMFLVSLFYVAGLRSFWMLWSWHFLSAAFLMAYMAIWIRRTRVMTAVELLHIRFGADTGGRMARTAGAVLMVTFLVFSIGYAFVGISKFLPHIIPDSVPGNGQIWAIVLMALTTLYVTAGGLSGVVATSLIQAVLMSLAGILVGVVVFFKLDPEMLQTLHENFDVNMLPQAKLSMPEGYEDWNNFGILCVFWFIAGFLLNASGAGGHYQEQRFLATRSEADAARTGAAWGFFLIPRWIMIAGFCFIAGSGMVGSEDPEQILPIVLTDMIPSGLRGLILAALIAAFMSTFSSVINAAASMVVRDLVHPFRPTLSDKAQVRLSYLVTVAAVVLGIVAGYNAETIRSIWTWMIIGLIGGTLIPNVLRWHWWRLNGWGYSAGIFLGLITALLVRFNVFGENPPEYFYAPVVWATTLVGCVLGSLLTAPTKTETLEHFYKSVRPFGFWGPIKARVDVSGFEPSVDRPLIRVIFNVVLAVVCMTSSFVSTFFIVGHYVKGSIITISLAVTSGIVLYFNWYRPLMRSEKKQKRMDV